MIYSTNGFIDSSNDSSSGDPRIVELPSTSPYQGTLDTILGDSGTVISSDATQPIITSPAQPIITSPDLDASTLMPPPQGLPVRRSQLVLQQQQSPQSTANAAVALLSSLGPTATATSSSVQAANAVSGSKPSRSSQRGTTSTGIAQLPSSSSATSQSLQPLTRATIGSRGGNVAAFLTKSYNMVNEPGSDNLIKWSEDGQSFVVLNHVMFAKEVLPKFFKHNNFSSFVRQLNMYGFHKVPHLQQGVLMPNTESEQWEFSNPHFQKNQPDLLNLVSRKKASNGNEDKDTLTTDLGNIMKEVAAIKRHQVAISTDLKNIERDHQSLWQESIAARERHHRQQETVDKILRFLASVFSGDKKRAIVPNKKVRLTITDGEIDGSSSADVGRSLVEEEDDEEEDDKVEVLLAGKRKRSTTDDGTLLVDGLLGNNISPLNVGEMNPATLNMPSVARQTGGLKPNQMSATTNVAGASNQQPTISTIPNLNFPDYLTTLSALNYPNIGNGTTNNTLLGGLQFDLSNLSIPAALLPNAISPVHHDFLQSISTENAQSSTLTPPPLARLPPSLSQTQAGASAIKGVDQITQEMEQLQRSIEELRQHPLIADHFDVDDSDYLALADSYDPNMLGGLGNTYHGILSNDNPSTTPMPASLSAVPATNNGTQRTSSFVGTNPRISTVGEEDLEELLHMDPA